MTGTDERTELDPLEEHDRVYIKGLEDGRADTCAYHVEVLELLRDQVGDAFALTYLDGVDAGAAGLLAPYEPESFDPERVRATEFYRLRAGSLFAPAIASARALGASTLNREGVQQ